jgi:hypothetical protein
VETFQKYGEKFEQLCRTENTAIYRRSHDGKPRTLEVIVIRVSDRKPVKTDNRITWVSCEAHESYPASEKWGESAWTLTNEEAARKKYDLINGCSDTPSGSLRSPSRMARITDGIAQECISLPDRVRIADREELIDA